MENSELEKERQYYFDLGKLNGASEQRQKIDWYLFCRGIFVGMCIMQLIEMLP